VKAPDAGTARVGTDVLYRCARVGCNAVALAKYDGPPREALLEPREAAIRDMPKGWGYDRIGYVRDGDAAAESDVLHCPEHRVRPGG
jgi:hypothetical protein